MTNRREFLVKSAAAAATTAGFATQSMAESLTPSSQSKGAADFMDFVNPELRRALEQVSPFLSRLTYDDASLPELRRLMGTTSASPLEEPAVTEHQISGAKGDLDVSVYVTGASPANPNRQKRDWIADFRAMLSSRMASTANTG